MGGESCTVLRLRLMQKLAMSLRQTKYPNKNKAPMIHKNVMGQYSPFPKYQFLPDLPRETVPSQTSDMGEKTLKVLAHKFFFP